MTSPDFDSKAAWRALWALVIGFFMILLDTTIVSMAMPAIMGALHADLTAIIWVNSAYLLTFAVPLLITGRLGDRFGPRNIYLIGLVLFTGASAWCGLSPSIGSLIAARAVQGFGAAMMSPQSMTMITRLFPYRHRGAAMGVWGAVAGVASLVGPIAGGLLVDTLGWEWIFFINLPVGVLTFILVMRWVPKLQPHSPTFDTLGVILSAAAMFALVYGIQEGDSTNWEPFIGPIGSVHLIVAGLVLFAAFIWWQSRTTKEPLVPLGLFRDRNFSLANLGISFMGLAITTLSLPMIFYLQSVRELTPTQAALLMSPMAIVSAVCAPWVGKRVTAHDPRKFAIPGFALFGGGIVSYAFLMHADTPLWVLLLPPVLQGLGSAMIWPSLSLTATRDLGPVNAGAGSGVYNTTRQIGAVLGSALIAVMMQSRISAQVQSQAGPDAPLPDVSGELTPGAVLPDFLHEPISVGLGQAMLLPGLVALAAILVVVFFRGRPAEQPQQAKQPVQQD